MQTKPLVKNRDDIKLAVLGMVEGNGHPYSWSAIFNGYDPDVMKDCRYAAIPAYLEKQPKSTFGIAGAKVTHIHCDKFEEAEHVAKASFIPHVLKNPEDAIGQVDAVLVATDIGSEHVARCRSFVEAGIPVFVDKPMVDNAEDLKIFCDWVNDGASILSSSSMRYCKEFAPYRISTHNLGELRYASITTPKTWERYGIHALEAVYPILGAGFISATHSGTAEHNIVHFSHKDNVELVVAAIYDMFGSYGNLTLAGTAGSAQVNHSDSYYSFKTQLEAFIQYLQTGERPFPWSDTVELMKMVIAGLMSREQNGRKVLLEEVK
ncbi:MAG: Gfo/Idh/MocA family oxidoreductase [Abditibacteriaceae bacterium]